MCAEFMCYNTQVKSGRCLRACMEATTASRIKKSLTHPARNPIVAIGTDDYENGITYSSDTVTRGSTARLS